MKFVITFLFFVIYFSATAQSCTGPGEAQIDLNVNNINAKLLNSGDFWWNGSNGRYITPSDGIEEVSAIFAGALWIGGVDPNGNLKLAAQTYRSAERTDFYPGPLTDDTGEAFEDGCTNWDRFWLVNKSEIDAHLLDFNDGIIDLQLDNVYSWPGKNNPHFQAFTGFPLPENQKFAPFYDNDFDGNYNPDNGDFPLIKGDQSIWWVFNDNAGPHFTNSTPIQMEVHAMAYAFANGNNEDLNNATFYDFEIINKASVDLMDGFIGLWVDFDFGCSADDFVGYDEEYQMMYVYNQDATDGDPGVECIGGTPTYGDEIPMLGIKKMDGNVNPVTSYVVIDQYLGTVTSSPVLANEYYNILNGLWSDGTPVTIGDDGYNINSSDTTKFSFSSDPSDENGWNMCSINPIGDWRPVMSSAMPDLHPGQSTTASYAVIYAENIDYPCPSLDRLKEAADAVCDAVLTSTEAPISKVTFTVSPNPATNVIKISSENLITSVKVMDLSGQVVLVDTGSRNKIKTLDLSNLAPSIYMISITDDQGNVGIKKVVKN